MKKIRLVAWREYWRTVRKRSFWLSTLALPLLILIVSGISAYSGNVAENKAKEDAKNTKPIAIVDHSKLLKTEALPALFVMAEDDQEVQEQVKSGQLEAAFVYPTDPTTAPIQVFAQDKGLLSTNRFDSVATELLKQSILLNLPESTQLRVFNAMLHVETVNYQNGKPVSLRLEDFIMPIVSVAIYFILTMFATSYLLMSVSEEKENRMIETVLSLMSPRELIWGKIIGLTGVVLTQLLILLALALAILAGVNSFFPLHLDFSLVHVQPLQVLFALFCTIAGFLFISSIMVGVGASMPSYRDAQGFSSVFIIMSIFPIYFGALLIAEPKGLIAMITSYFPFTAPLILLFRSAMQALAPWEYVVGPLALAVYVYIGLVVAFKLFELGSLEYYQKISWKLLWFKNKAK